ncbi:MAG: hypothetical protein QOI77_162 [Blastocatellia bacterium]|jgi:hypothetical protein|nr:hypothetical protein [Blastocatellia bacterium]
MFIDTKPKTDLSLRRSEMLSRFSELVRSF